MNRAIKTSIRKTVCAVRSAREYKKMLKNMNIDVDEPSGLNIIYTGYSMKVGGSGQLFDDFIHNGTIVCPKDFEIIKFDETFTYGKNIPENGRYINVTVTVYFPSSRIDHFTPLMILYSIQSNSAACSNSMNCNCPLIWIIFACCVVFFRKFLLKCMKGISCYAIVLAPYQEIFFLFSGQNLGNYF